MGIVYKKKKVATVGSPSLRVLGLDISTKTGLVVLDCTPAQGVTTLEATLIHYPGETGMARVIKITNAVLGLVHQWEPQVIVIEGYAYANSHTLALLVEIGTLIRYKLFDLGLPYFEVSPGGLKLFTCGKGNAPKELMRLAVYKAWGFEHASNDVVDAYALARFGLALGGKEKSLPKKNMEAVQTVRSSHPKLFKKTTAFFSSCN